MSKVQIINGNETAAMGAKLCRVQVIAAYPITPQSKIPETLIKYVESGELEAEFIRVESEHSALTVCISASTVGARVFTATAANGLAYMHEQLHWAAGARLPIVMALANRGLGAPWTIFNDMQDSISQRDTGWMQVYCRDNQEIMDSIIMAYKICEQLHVPMMVCFDGFVLSHTVMPVEIPDQKQVDAFLPPYVPHLQVDGPDAEDVDHDEQLQSFQRFFEPSVAVGNGQKRVARHAKQRPHLPLTRREDLVRHEACGERVGDGR